jgi:hypothetical protein
MVWFTQNMIAKLFDKGRSTITEHLNLIYNEKELDKNLTCRIFRQVQKEGNRDIFKDNYFFFNYSLPKFITNSSDLMYALF